MKQSTRRKRLRKLARSIVKHEDKFDMGTWFDDATDLPGDEVIKRVIKKRRPICGTSGCAAGWAVFLFGTKKQIKDCISEDGDWVTEAQGLLGMTESEAEIFIYNAGDAPEIAKELRQMAEVKPL